MATKDMTKKMNMSGKKRFGESEMNGLEELTELEGRRLLTEKGGRSEWKGERWMEKKRGV